MSVDYLPYQVWDTLQAFCSSITGTLATLAILKGVGVGDSSATPLAATITWMLKDGTGMLGRILFGWMAATDLDCNAKFWRLIADILNDLANFFELLAPLFPGLFLLIVCSASVSKAIVGVAGGATRAALIQHQARRDNMADVAAKDGSQETVVNLVALLINLVLTPLVAGKTELVWTLFVLFTILHLLANYRAVRVVTMETLNQARLHLVMATYLGTGSVPPVSKVNAREPILWTTGRAVAYKLGVSLSDTILSAEQYEAAKREALPAIMRFDPSTHCIHVSLSSSSDATTQLKVAMAVEMVDHFIQHDWSHWMPQGPTLLPHLQTIHALRGDIPGSLKLAQRLVEDVYPDLSSKLKQVGWVTSHLLLSVGEWRFTWEARKTL